MKSIFLVITALFFSSCENDYSDDPDVPAGIICEVCEVAVSKTASHCKNCQHPVEESIRSHKKLNRKFSRIFTLVSNDDGIKKRKEDFEMSWGKIINEAKKLEELDLISLPHTVVKFIDSNFTPVFPKGFLGMRGSDFIPSPNTVLFDGNQTFNGWLKDVSDYRVSVVEVKDGLLNGTFNSWYKSGIHAWGKHEDGQFVNGKAEGHWNQHYRIIDFSKRFSNGKFRETEYANGIPISERVSVAVPQWSLSVKKKKNSA